MAVHAGFGRRHPGRGRRFDGRMAITAIDAVVADVMFMGKLNRLLSRNERLGNIRGPAQLKQNPKGTPSKKQADDDTQPRKRIHAAVEELWHRRTSTSRTNCSILDT